MIVVAVVVAAGAFEIVLMVGPNSVEAVVYLDSHATNRRVLAELVGHSLTER